MSGSVNPGPLVPLAHKWLVLAIALASAGLAWFARDLEGLRHRYEKEDRGQWFSRDPDGLYHARRVRRAMDEAGESHLAAGTDPYLDPPRGAPIPWPPYYDTALAKVLAPFAPAQEPQRSVFIERRVSTLPAYFGVATSVAAALAGAFVGGPVAAAFAGFSNASSWGAVNYSVVGTGDHHAWIACLHALALWLATWALGRGVLLSRRAGLGVGLGIGVLYGVMLGSWVASLLLLAYAQIWLGWFVWRSAREHLPGAAGLGLGVHLGALVSVLPAVLASPWRHEFPWMVVNLSWFHPAWIAAGAFACLVPAITYAGALAPGTRAARAWLPTLLLAGLAAAALSWNIPGGPVAGMREGFAWVSRADRFMNTVRESAPLIGPRGDWRALMLAIGAGVFLLPLALMLAARSAWRERTAALVPWIVCAPPMLIQALMQRRFSDVLALPLAVLVGWALARCCARARLLWTVPLALGLALALQGVGVQEVLSKRSRAKAFNIGTQLDHYVGERRAIEWMRGGAAQVQPGETARAVLAHWDRGHAIEWAADRPSVATNFGSYISLDSYLDPSRFFLESDPQRAEELLQARNVRFVFVPGELPALVPSMVTAVAPERAEEWLVPAQPPAVPRTNERWLRSMGARLLHEGIALGPPEQVAWGLEHPLSFLRLVHVSKYSNQLHLDPRTRAPRPAALVWEYVQGAQVEVPGKAGETAQLWVEVRFREPDLSVPWSARAPVGPDGLARFRVPYATEASQASHNDAASARGHFQVGQRTGELTIPSAAVQAGTVVRVP